MLYVIRTSRYLYLRSELFFKSVEGICCTWYRTSRYLRSEIFFNSFEGICYTWLERADIYIYEGRYFLTVLNEYVVHDIERADIYEARYFFNSFEGICYTWLERADIYIYEVRYFFNSFEGICYTWLERADIYEAR